MTLARDIYEKITFVFFLPLENLKKSAIDPLKLYVMNLKNENITGKKKSHENKNCHPRKPKSPI